MASTVTGAPLGCGGTVDSHHTLAVLCMMAVLQAKVGSTFSSQGGTDKVARIKFMCVNAQLNPGPPENMGLGSSTVNANRLCFLLVVVP